ncbi:FtsX-like permease family protein, partial [Streptomyces sp. NPDC048340]|uniref:FtsX-like permease family protein n=1 Tax=Streptomyces sp. NPDC048340 TaxID=3365537 RepID=UPI0037236196
RGFRGGRRPIAPPASWSGSQHDQAGFATAGGLRISDSALAPMGRSGRYGSLPGGDRIVPVIRSRQELPGGKPGQVLALDATGMAERVPLRSDLREGRPMRDLFAPLAAPAPGGPGIALPGNAQRIDIDVAAQSVDFSGTTGRTLLGLMLRDRFGLIHQSPMLPLPENGESTLSMNLGTLTDAPIGSAAAPLHVAGVVINSSSPGGQLTVRQISTAADGNGPAVPVETTGPSGPAWNLSAPNVVGGEPAARLLTDGQPAGPALFRIGHAGGSHVLGGVKVTLTSTGPAAAELPATATRAYLKAIGASVGDLVPIALGGVPVQVRITAATGSFPVVGDTAVAVDAATAARLLAVTGQVLPAPSEWWLPAASAHDPNPARAAAELRAGVAAQQVELREEVAAGLLDDPLSAGPQAALAALAAACAVLAAIGFAASAAAAGRQRAQESAVLLALGAPRRSLVRTALAESGVLVGLGTAAGVGLGAAIVHLVVPLMVLTPTARRPVPSAVVDLPAGPTLLLALGIAAVPLLSAVLGARGRRNVAARLRYLEET